MMVSDELNVGIGEFKIANGAGVLNCQALGSCIAVFLYEPSLGVGAVAHIMLPSSSEGKKNEKEIKDKNSAKFADIAIRDMIEALRKKGANKPSLIAKIVGGAHMFRAGSNFVNDIGLRNVMAAKTILNYERIAVVAEDTGGDYGRTVRFYPADGKAKVRSGRGEKEI
jgi:chemotaxis protein CheD